MKETNHNIPASENTLQSLKEAQESYKRFAENLADIAPKIPDFELPRIPEFFKDWEPIEFVNSDVTREQNAWERHKEILDIQNALLGVQSKLLDEQKSNTKFTMIVIGLSILTIIISTVSIFL